MSQLHAVIIMISAHTFTHASSVMTLCRYTVFVTQCSLPVYCGEGIFLFSRVFDTLKRRKKDETMPYDLKHIRVVVGWQTRSVKTAVMVITTVVFSKHWVGINPLRPGKREGKIHDLFTVKTVLLT